MKCKRQVLNDKDFLKRQVESFYQKLKDVEITQFLYAVSIRDKMKRCDYRNSCKPRKLKRRGGTLGLLVPQDREGRFRTQLFARYFALMRTKEIMEKYESVYPKFTQKLEDTLACFSFPATKAYIRDFF